LCCGDTGFDEGTLKPDSFVKEIVEELVPKSFSPGFRPSGFDRIALTFLGLSEQTLCL